MPFSTLRQFFSHAELRQRLLYTLLFLALARLGTFVLLPGIDIALFQGQQASGILAWLDTLLGGSLTTFSVFSLGITPYISASILVQFASLSIPYFQRLQKEGPSGSAKLSQLTRLLTLAVAPMQAMPFLVAMKDVPLLLPRYYFVPLALLLLTTGTACCLWLADRISDKGLGNGTSLLISAGILSRLPLALTGEATRHGSAGMLPFVLTLLVLLALILIVIAFMQAVRKLPLQNVKQATYMYAGAYQAPRQYLPVKVNVAGVMPIIMASMLSALPRLIARLLRNKSDIAAYVNTVMSNVNGWQYNAVLALLIFFATYFYTAVFFNPTEIADTLKRNGSFIPGIKPGTPTALYIDSILSRILLPGSLFLALIAVLPPLAYYAGVSEPFSRFFGGTSQLIIIGALLDVVEKVQAYLFHHQYSQLAERPISAKKPVFHDF